MTPTGNQARWWEHEPWIVFEVNMITLPGYGAAGWQDWADPSAMVDMAKASNALQVHATCFMSPHITNRFCYFKSAQFKEQRRDFLAEYLEKSRAAGLRTVVYFNIHAVKPDFGLDQPGWRQIRDDGTPLDGLYGVETSMCVNTGFRDWVRDVCVDLCQYPIDGIFFDGPALFQRCCYCEACKRLYRERYGAEMPLKQPGNPALKQLADFQAESMRDFMEHSNRAIKAVRPDVALYGNSGKREEPYYVSGRNNRILIQSQDMLTAEGGFVYGELSGQPSWKAGSNAKYYQTQAMGKPTGVFISPAHGPWRSYYRPEAELRLDMAQAFLNGSGAWLACFKWFEEQPAFHGVAEDLLFFRKQSHWHFRSRSRARAAIVWPEDSVNFYSKPAVLDGDFTQGGQAGEKVGDIQSEFNGFYDALLQAHVPCDVIDEESLRRGEAARYDLLVLPNVACTGEPVDASLREFVRNGGTLIASFETSLCDETGRRRADLGLADVLGVRMLRTPLKPFPHFYFHKGQDAAVFKDIEPSLLPAPLVNCEVALAGARALSFYSTKFKGWDGSEILPSEFPAITVNEFGKGRAIYLAGVFGTLHWLYRQPDVRRLLRNLFHWLSPQDVRFENAPTSVEVIHRESPCGAQVVNLINYTGGISRPFERIEELRDITIRLRTGRNSARALRLDEPLPARREGEWLVVELPRLHLFEMIVIE